MGSKEAMPQTTNLHGIPGLPGVLTDQVLDLVTENRRPVAVLPCCHDLRACDTDSLAGWMDGPLAVDSARGARLWQAGYRVQTAFASRRRSRQRTGY